MLVFGPYSAIPRDEDFIIYNLSSLTESIPRLPGLLVAPENISNIFNIEDKEFQERQFDIWYYEYLLNDVTACSSLMTILKSLYDGNKVYICIQEYSASDVISILNESFMKFIQSRYDIMYSIINTPEDYEYIPKDGCDFASVAGIMNFDKDLKEFMYNCVENQLMSTGKML